MKIFTHIGMIPFMSNTTGNGIWSKMSEKELWIILDWRSIYKHMWE